MNLGRCPALNVMSFPPVMQNGPIELSQSVPHNSPRAFPKSLPEPSFFICKPQSPPACLDSNKKEARRPHSNIPTCHFPSETAFGLVSRPFYDHFFLSFPPVSQKHNHRPLAPSVLFCSLISSVFSVSVPNAAYGECNLFFILRTMRGHYMYPAHGLDPQGVVALVTYRPSCAHAADHLPPTTPDGPTHPIYRALQNTPITSRRIDQ